MAERVTQQSLEDSLESINSYIRHLDNAGIKHGFPRTLELRRQDGRYGIVEVVNPGSGERDFAAKRSPKEMRAYLHGLHRGIGLIATPNWK